LLLERDVAVDVPPDLPCVMVEPALIEQLLLNLLENAARHTPPQSRIAVAARAQGDMIMLSVSDDGPGIAPREREQLFQEFFRGTHARRGDGGIGLGLSICRAIARAHGGSIVIGERRGGGTCVEFSMPASRALSSRRLEELA
jgi:two-component system sensor histidine kinase KdpD